MLGLLKAILKPKEPAKHNLSASTSAIMVGLLLLERDSALYSSQDTMR
jgi:hypothetical protein